MTSGALGRPGRVARWRKAPGPAAKPLGAWLARAARAAREGIRVRAGTPRVDGTVSVICAKRLRVKPCVSFCTSKGKVGAKHKAVRRARGRERKGRGRRGQGPGGRDRRTDTGRTAVAAGAGRRFRRSIRKNHVLPGPTDRDLHFGKNGIVLRHGPPTGHTAHNM